jgi:hypothetical protein
MIVEQNHPKLDHVGEIYNFFIFRKQMILYRALYNGVKTGADESHDPCWSLNIRQNTHIYFNKRYPPDVTSKIHISTTNYQTVFSKIF